MTLPESLTRQRKRFGLPMRTGLVRVNTHKTTEEADWSSRDEVMTSPEGSGPVSRGVDLTLMMKL
ncbi:hypothetical protein EYF80_053046 [Liparis tanakae]|uniref:Uncharacterized protein n=1 Tax=Liparis tanakae TaxID=230148 RepID=A0A4Z2F7K6_9TELE|nr:hypothetical protein EYF80_053046 [Liparis tanakae]